MAQTTSDKSDAQHILAASYKRLAKTLRIMVVNHRSAARRLKHFPDTRDALYLRAQVATDLAEEFEHEARLLRAK